MKKLLSFVLLLTLSYTFSACGGSDDDEPEKFVWGGDWNDPNSPGYKPEYHGKYNPIQGLWKHSQDSQIGYYFSEDYIGYDVDFYVSGEYTKTKYSKYGINKDAFRYETSRTFRYKMNKDDDNILYLASQNMDFPSENWQKYVRVKE
ncbi:MAG: hypothetical protein LBL79_08670 [Prevotella sp.]|jgi:hypothetical protein|nr:hypothetical protein [Prevotella sp.]